jgi:hypothetical protein
MSMKRIVGIVGVGEDLFPTRELSNTALCHSAMALLYMQRKMSAEDNLLSNGKSCGDSGGGGR